MLITTTFGEQTPVILGSHLGPEVLLSIPNAGWTSA